MYVGSSAVHSVIVVCLVLNSTTMIYFTNITIPFLHSGGNVVHSEGRLIPHEFPITDLQQISGTDGIGRIDCTVSSGTARLVDYGSDTDEVTETKNGATATLAVNPTDVDSFQNRDLYCTNIATNYFYLFISSTG